MESILVATAVASLIYLLLLILASLVVSPSVLGSWIDARPKFVQALILIPIIPAGIAFALLLWTIFMVPAWAYLQFTLANFDPLTSLTISIIVALLALIFIVLLTRTIFQMQEAQKSRFAQVIPQMLVLMLVFLLIATCWLITGNALLLLRPK